MFNVYCSVANGIKLILSENVFTVKCMRLTIMLVENRFYYNHILNTI